MIGLGAGTENGFHFDEIADLGFLADFRTRAQTGERTDDRLRRDGRAFDVAKRLDRRAVRDLDARTEDDVRFDGHVAAELSVCREPDAFGIDERRTVLERLLAGGAASPARDARARRGCSRPPSRKGRLDHDRVAALRSGDVHHVGQVIFARGIVFADLVEPAEQSFARTAIMPLLQRRTARSSSVASLNSTIFAIWSPSPRMMRP